MTDWNIIIITLELQEIEAVEENLSPSSQRKNITVVHKSKSGMELGRFVPNYPCIGTASM